MLQATGVCPADLLKTASVKKVFDGGKWLCGASRLKAMVAEGRRPVVCKLHPELYGMRQPSLTSLATPSPPLPLNSTIEIHCAQIRLDASSRPILKKLSRN